VGAGNKNRAYLAFSIKKGRTPLQCPAPNNQTNQPLTPEYD
jgi:hypothetical protein